MNMAGENGVKGFEFRKPDTRTKWQNFQKSIYNSSTHQFLGRTGKSWAQLLTFYSIFYLVLAALFAICMQGLLAVLDDHKPHRTLSDSLIGTNPGLGFRPISKRTEEGSLIWYDMKNRTTGEKWVGLLNEFLDLYRQNQTGQNFDTCDYDKPAGDGKVCVVDLTSFGPCSPDNSYGYFNSSSPCVFLKLNKIYDWIPEYYTEPEESMPTELKDVISSTSKFANKTQVWVSCEGASAIDRENAPNFDYYPSRGFPSYYFPYRNTKNYLSPLIAVRLRNPTPNVLISVECRAWAKNIIYKGGKGGDLQRQGSIHFEILQDNKD